jgi:hypothetical protein
MKILIKLLLLTLFISSRYIYVHAAMTTTSDYDDYDESTGTNGKFYDAEKGEGNLNEFFQEHSNGTTLVLKDNPNQPCAFLQDVPAFNKANIWSSLKIYIDQKKIEQLELYLGGSSDITPDDSKTFMKSLITLSFQCASLKLIEIKPKDDAFKEEKQKKAAVSNSITMLGASIQELIPALIQGDDGATIDVAVKTIKFGEYEIPIVCVTEKKKETNKVATIVSSLLSSALGVGVTLIGQYLATL